MASRCRPSTHSAPGFSISFRSKPAVAARFDVLDEASEAQLLGETSLGVLLDATLTPDAPLGRALATAITFAADRTFKEVVGEAIRKRDVVRAWIDHGGSVDAAVALLCGTLGISSDDTLERSRKRDDRGTAASRSRAGRPLRRSCMQGLKERSGSSGAACVTRRDIGFRTVSSIYLEVFFTDKLEATPSRDHQGLARK